MGRMAWSTQRSKKKRPVDLSADRSASKINELVVDSVELPFNRSALVFAMELKQESRQAAHQQAPRATYDAGPSALDVDLDETRRAGIATIGIVESHRRNHLIPLIVETP